MAHAFYGELEKIARANPMDVANSLRGFTRAAKSADPSVHKSLRLSGHSTVDSMRNKWALQKARAAARSEANTKLKSMSAEARQSLSTGSPAEKARALARLEGIEEARGTRGGARGAKKKKMMDYLPSPPTGKKGMSGPKWAATGLGAGAAGTLLAQNQIANLSQDAGGEYY